MLNERVHNGQFLILSTLDHHSRVEVTVAAGLDLDAGAVLAIDATDSDLAKEFDNSVAAVNTVAGILYNRVDTTAATGTGVDTKAVMVEAGMGDHVVDGTLLVWKTGVDAAEQTAAIAAMKALRVYVVNV